eukprot:CAMPEP_0197854814 /NCGR_PEP_ID=MMETSP1438-20131217/25383_1 /TAXON_ID=1461541 /ORGANISM="Pterosperma sp., Strain CCMP1384" /LENGTH=180 /DNA_ID=CAMNT_0043469695 /DNA_START=208 /DNA_END=748 /DNA_ORIENTATION=+
MAEYVGREVSKKFGKKFYKGKVKEHDPDDKKLPFLADLMKILIPVKQYKKSSGVERGKKRNSGAAENKAPAAKRNKPGADTIEQGYMWLVFETEEQGGNGYVGGYAGSFDNGSHRAALLGAYSSEISAEAHAAEIRGQRGSDDDDDDDNGEPTYEHHTVEVVKVKMQHAYSADNTRRPLW